MNPHAVLDEVKAIIDERGQDYGQIENNFETARVIFDCADYCVENIHEPWHVAMMMVSVKLARMKNSPAKRDNYLDCIAYLAFAAELIGAK